MPATSGQPGLDNLNKWNLGRYQVLLLHGKLKRSVENLPHRLGFLMGLAGIGSVKYLLTHSRLPSQ